MIGLAASLSDAAAVTYVGTRGDQKIILELTEPEYGPVLGRYTQLSDGVDVPLQFLGSGKDGFELAEEQPCMPQVCVVPEDGDYSGAPLGAHWTLHYSSERSTLTGLSRAEPPASIITPMTSATAALLEPDFQVLGSQQQQSDPSLTDWVIAAYIKTPDYAAGSAADCEMNENIADHLDISFGVDDTAVFLIGGIDRAACMGAIVAMPLADIRNLLTANAADYFTSLK